MSDISAPGDLFPTLLVAKACATTSITLSGAQTVDGQSMATGDLCFAIGQGFVTAIGLFVVQSAGAWTRPTFAPTGGVLLGGYAVSVIAGTENKGLWVNLNTGLVVVDTTFQVFSRPLVGSTYARRLSAFRSFR